MELSRRGLFKLLAGAVTTGPPALAALAKVEEVVVVPPKIHFQNPNLVNYLDGRWVPFAVTIGYNNAYYDLEIDGKPCWVPWSMDIHQDVRETTTMGDGWRTFEPWGWPTFNMQLRQDSFYVDLEGLIRDTVFEDNAIRGTGTFRGKMLLRSVSPGYNVG